MSSTLEWARMHPEREFRRIISAPDSGSILDWLSEHHKETEAISNYKVRVTPASAPVTDISFAIIDHKTVILAICGDGTSMTIYFFEAHEAVLAFREHFIQKWEHAEDLSEYLRKFSAQN